MRTSTKARRVARRLFRLCLVNGMVDEPRVRLVAQRLASSGRRGARNILSDFARSVRVDRRRHTALVESASPLPADLRDEVRTCLTRLYGPGLDTSFEQNPDLIGGLRIAVGSDVYDASVRARLAELEARF